MEIPESAIQWLANGERGLSSETMFVALASPSTMSLDRIHYPYDPDDFKRCEKLLRQVPSWRMKLPLMKALSPEWRALVDHWDCIVMSFEEEAPGILDGAINRWAAPQTARLIRIVRELGRRAYESAR